MRLTDVELAGSTWPVSGTLGVVDKAATSLEGNITRPIPRASISEDILCSDVTHCKIINNMILVSCCRPTAAARASSSPKHCIQNAGELYNSRADYGAPINFRNRIRICD